MIVGTISRILKFFSFCKFGFGFSLLIHLLSKKVNFVSSTNTTRFQESFNNFSRFRVCFFKQYLIYRITIMTTSQAKGLFLNWIHLLYWKSRECQLSFAKNLIVQEEYWGHIFLFFLGLKKIWLYKTKYLHYFG